MSETQTPYPTQDYDDATYALNHPENDAPEPQQSPRTFYRSDYGRAARLIQAARHVPGDVYTAKPEAQQDTVGALAVTFVQVFQADSDRFDAERFIRATWLPAKPEFQGAADDVDDYPEENGYSESLAREDARNGWQHGEVSIPE
jgi:hypothetical protein